MPSMPRWQETNMIHLNPAENSGVFNCEDCVKQGSFNGLIA